MICNVIFDLDGTLLDTSGDIVECLIKAYHCCGKVLPGAGIDRSQIGPPLREMISNITPGISPQETDAIMTEFRRRYDCCNYSGTVIYDGVYEAVEALNRAGVAMFIATNKPHVPTVKMLLAYRLLPFFRDIIAPDPACGMAFNKTEMIYYLMEKWSLRKDETVVVGDTVSDVQAAHYNGVSAVAFLGGYGERESLQRSGPEYIIDSMKALRGIMVNCEGGLADE